MKARPNQGRKPGRKTATVAVLALCLVGVTLASLATPAEAWTCRFGMAGTYFECKGTVCAAGVAPTPWGTVVGCAAADWP